MATIKLTGLSETQARSIHNALEDGEWDTFNEILESDDLTKIDLEGSNISSDEEGETVYTLKFVSEEDDVEIEEVEELERDVEDEDEDNNLPPVEYY